MRNLLSLILVVVAGCKAVPDTRERGPQHTVAYLVPVETSEAARIEVNGSDLGPAPLTVKIFGDKDGTFHNFGTPGTWDITAYPARAGSHAQTKKYGTGGFFQREDRIPDRIYFELRSEPAEAK